MSTYKNLIGKDVNFLSTDPDNTQAEGQIWYNSTSNVFKDLITSNAWSSGAPLITGRSRMAGCGTQTVGLGFGGYSPNTGKTEEYNGTGWANGGALNTARYNLGGCGTQTAGLGFAGYNGSTLKNESEEYNGSSWTEGNNVNTSRQMLAASGTQTAGLGFGGYTPSPAANKNETEEYDGTSWSEQNNLNTARRILAGAGTQTAGLAFGGFVTTSSASTEEYDGTSWTASNDLNTARYALGGAGTQTSALAFGGSSNKTEKYDGTSWSEVGDLATSRSYIAGCGSSNASALAFGGNPNKSETEEFTSSANVITGGAFASSPTLSYSVDANLATSGSLTSAVAAGGYNAPAGPGTVSYIAKAATWNGTAWSNITDMPERRTSNNAVGATAPAFYTFGGQNQPGPSTSTHLPSTYSWNGSSWSSGPALAEGQAGGAGAGTPSAIVLMGGTNPPGSISNNIQQYNGSSWSNSPVNMPTNMSSNGGVGTQTAAISFGGYQGASPFPSAGVTNTYEWDGSSISSGGSMVFGLLGCSGSGTSTAALSYGGRNTAGNKNAIGMIYNGTSWATQPSLAVARDYVAMGPMGSATNCLAVAGSGGAQSLVEEFTGETSALNIKTITTS
jgi:hypothetical protein